MTLSYPNILLDALEIGVIILDENYTVHYWNKWLEINTGISASRIMGSSLEAYYPQIDYTSLSRKIRTSLRINAPTFYDAVVSNRFIPIKRTKITTSLLSEMQLQVIISPYLSEQGMVMVSIYNISELHELKLELQHKMEKIAHLNEDLNREKAIIDANLLIVKIDAECRILEVTKAFMEFFGCCETSLLGHPMEQVFKEGMLDFDPEHIRAAMEKSERWSGEVKAVMDGNRAVWFDTVVAPIGSKENEGTHYSVIFHDITDKKRIEFLSITDPLTKLYNRNKFNDVMEKMFLRRHWDMDNSFSLVIVDIDHFKQVNDTYGHGTGDEVLKAAAERLSQTLRTGDVVARWGGEEFVCLLPNVTVGSALLVAEKLREGFESLEIPNVRRITASFGVSVYRQGDTPEELFHRADKALYKAKHNGRNRVEIA